MHIGVVVFGSFQDLLGSNSAGGIKAKNALGLCDRSNCIFLELNGAGK